MKAATGANALLGASLVAVVAMSAVLAGDDAPVHVIGYGGTSDSAYVLHVVSGASIIAVGWFTRILRPSSPVGLLAVSVGVVWFAPDWVAWDDGPPMVRTLGMLVIPLASALLAHLTIASTPGPTAPVWRRGLAVATGAVAALSLVRLAVYDPFFDHDCLANCTDNTFLVRRTPALSEALTDVLDVSGVAIGSGVAALTFGSLTTATSTARRSAAVALVPALVALLATVTYHGSKLIGPAEAPVEPLFVAIHWWRGISLVLLAVGLAATLMERWRARRAVASIAASVDQLGEGRRLEQLLADALSDPGLRVGYWIDDSPQLVDSSGRPFDPPTGDDHVGTTVARNGRPVAVVFHDRSRADCEAIADELGPAARLALDNERLRAAAHRQVDELRRSQARIVAAADRERRRLERDLHDGAQQWLLAASYALRLAAADADLAGDADLGEFARRAIDDVRRELEELRAIAHGIHPAVLTESGLAAALHGLRASTSMPIDVTGCTELRSDPLTEATAYAATIETIDVAQRRGSSFVAVSSEVCGSQFSVTVAHDAVIAPAELIDVADRVGAAGGTLEVNGRTVTARIPCVP